MLTLAKIFGPNVKDLHPGKCTHITLTDEIPFIKRCRHKVKMTRELCVKHDVKQDDAK